MKDEWFPVLHRDLVLFYMMYGIEKEGVNKTGLDVVTSHTASGGIVTTERSEGKTASIDINQIRHIITPHYPAYQVSTTMPKGDVWNEYEYVFGYETKDDDISDSDCYEVIANVIESHLDECSNEIEKEYLKICAEKCRKLAKDLVNINFEDEVEDEPTDLVSKIQKEIEDLEVNIKFNEDMAKEYKKDQETRRELLKLAQDKWIATQE